MLKWASQYAIAILAVLPLLLTQTEAKADFCPATYASSDRDAIRRVFITNAVEYLSQLQSLSILVASGELGFAESDGLNAGFQSRLNDFKSLWSNNAHLRPETNRWLKRVSMTGFADLYATQITGENPQAAIDNAVNANNIVASALEQIGYCF